MRISDWSSDVCSSDLNGGGVRARATLPTFALVDADDQLAALRRTLATPATREVQDLASPGRDGKGEVETRDRIHTGPGVAQARARSHEAAREHLELQHQIEPRQVVTCVEGGRSSARLDEGSVTSHRQIHADGQHGEPRRPVGTVTMAGDAGFALPADEIGRAHV